MCGCIFFLNLRIKGFKIQKITTIAPSLWNFFFQRLAKITLYEKQSKIKFFFHFLKNQQLIEMKKFPS